MLKTQRVIQSVGQNKSTFCLGQGLVYFFWLVCMQADSLPEWVIYAEPNDGNAEALREEYFQRVLAIPV